MGRRNIRAMLEPSGDTIITNSAGCGAMMKEYGELLADNPKYADRARDFESIVKDITEFLAAAGLRPPKRPLKARVTYQDPCHLAHAQKVRSAPRELLAALGAELVMIVSFVGSSMERILRRPIFCASSRYPACACSAPQQR